MTETYATDLAERMLDDAGFRRIGTGLSWNKLAGDAVMIATIIPGDERISVAFRNKRSMELASPISISLTVPGAAILTAIGETKIWS